MINQLIAAGIIASASFGSAWQIQTWRMDAKEKDRAEAVVRDQKIAFRRYEVDQDRVHAAQASATIRIQRLRLAVDSARNELDGLRSTTAEANRRAVTASEAALREYTTTINSVFDQCTREYLRMAEKAQGHADDVRTLIEAAPK